MTYRSFHVGHDMVLVGFISGSIDATPLMAHHHHQGGPKPLDTTQQSRFDRSVDRIVDSADDTNVTSTLLKEEFGGHAPVSTDQNDSTPALVLMDFQGLVLGLTAVIKDKGHINDTCTMGLLVTTTGRGVACFLSSLFISCQV